MAIVAAVLLILSGVLLLLPSTTESYVPPTEFQPVSRPDWYAAGNLFLPAGDMLSCTFISSSILVLGFANSDSWDNFTSGTVSAPLLLSSATGITGSFSLRSNSFTDVVLVGNWNPQNVDYFKVLITAYDYQAFHPYAYLAFTFGLIAAGTSVGYERLKRLSLRFRAGR